MKIKTKVLQEQETLEGHGPKVVCAHVSASVSVCVRAASEASN